MPDPRGKRGTSLVQHLTEQAGSKYVGTGLSLDKYFYAADLLLLQANQYRASGNKEQLYVMLMRYASLIIESVGKHKDLRKDNPRYIKHQKMLVTQLMDELEQLKFVLNTQSLVACSANRPADAVQISASNLPDITWYGGTLPSRPPANTTAAPPLPDYSAHPVRVSRDALDFLSADPLSPVAPPPPSPSLPTPSTPTPLERQSSTSTSYSSISQSAIISQQTYNRHSLYSRNSHAVALSAPAQQAYQPSTAFSRPAPRYPVDLLDSLPSAPAVQADAGQLPLQDACDIGALSIDGPPPLPAPSAGPTLGPQEMQVMDMQSHHADPNGTCAAPPPEAVGGVKPYTKKASLRDIQIAVSLLEDFLRLAQANTRRGIESCGILAGVLSANDSFFTITTLIVPKQKGSSDQVEMLSEEEIFDIQMSRELYPLGWIHTHPTQTCFLSSIDVHTQCGYQTMLDEAVAIVMAPTDSRKRCGIFRLTTPGGLELIQKCTSRGFHMHPPTSTGQEIYEFSGHTFLNPRLQHDVVDLR